MSVSDHRNVKHGFKLAQHMLFAQTLASFQGISKKKLFNSAISTCQISGSWSKPH